jgi:hypothetical protein
MSITVEGVYVRVHGKRAQYRVHLASGSIHIEPGGYLCVVPDSAAQGKSRGLFLPFAEEAAATCQVRANRPTPRS